MGEIMLIVVNILYILLSVICLGIFVFASISIFKNLLQKDFKLNLLKNAALLLVALITFFAILPHAISTIGCYYKDFDSKIKLNKIASKMTILPKQKSQFEGNTGCYYIFAKDIENAISQFETASKYYIKHPDNKTNETWFKCAATAYLITEETNKANYFDIKSGNLDRVIANYIVKKDYDTALKLAEQLPESINAFGIKSFLYTKLNKKKEAKDVLEKALSLAKTDKEKAYAKLFQNYDKHLTNYYTKLKTSYGQGIQASPSLYIYELN